MKLPKQINFTNVLIIPSFIALGAGVVFGILASIFDSKILGYLSLAGFIPITVLFALVLVVYPYAYVYEAFQDKVPRFPGRMLVAHAIGILLSSIVIFGLLGLADSSDDEGACIGGRYLSESC